MHKNFTTFRLAARIVSNDAADFTQPNLSMSLVSSRYFRRLLLILEARRATPTLVLTEVELFRSIQSKMIFRALYNFAIIYFAHCPSFLQLAEEWSE